MPQSHASATEPAPPSSNGAAPPDLATGPARLPSNLSSPAAPPAPAATRKELPQINASIASSGKVAIHPSGSPEVMGSVGAAILSKRHNLADPRERARVVRELYDAAEAERRVTLEKAKRFRLPLVTANGAFLAGFEGDRPVYEGDENVNAAITTATSLVRDVFPYSVDGTGYSIGLWESGGIPRVTHEEFSGRLTIVDGSSGTSPHATHVAGTLIAAGMDPAVKGMASGASVLAHGSIDDEAEMMALAAAVPNEPGKVYISNHSYGSTTGWAILPWRWYGTFSDDEDPSNDHPDFFGRYSSDSACWDGIAWNAPYYLIFKSGGNDRDDNHPNNGITWRLNGSGTPIPYDDTQHPAADFEQMISGIVNGFGTVGQKSSCKNVVAVGAVHDAVSGVLRDLNEADMTGFSSFGPTDDGRIKPDLVANGQEVLSLDDDDDTDTRFDTGTSMASASACGSALLLIDYFDDRFPARAMRSSSLKGLMIHTADDLGNAGPDYRFGWGLLNTEAAAALIKDHADTANEGRMTESGLAMSIASRTLPLAWNGIDPIRVTLCWTDPPGAATTTHDDRAPRLVHDLNLKVTAPDGTTQYFPYVMPWVNNWTDAMLDAPATTGVNMVDNIEQVYIAAPTMPGEYVVTVDFAGALTMGPQDYSLIVSGGKLPRGYELWAAENYPGQWNNAALTGFAADPEENRISNGIEYAFDLEAGAANGTGGIYTRGRETIGENEFITLTFVRDTSKTDIVYEAQWTADGETWNSMPVEVLATNGVKETVKASLIVDGGEKFLRIRVTRL